MDAGKDLNQRRFAGAVLPQESDDLTWGYCDIDVVNGNNPGEPLPQMRRHDRRWRRGGFSRPRLADPAHDRHSFQRTG